MFRKRKLIDSKSKGTGPKSTKPKNRSKSVLFFRDSILSKMVIMFLLLIVIPVSTIGYISTQTAAKNLQQNASNSLTSATTLTSYYLDAFLQNAEDLLKQLTANQAILAYANFIASNRTGDGSNLQKKAEEVISNINLTAQDFKARVLYINGELLGEQRFTLLNMDNIKGTSWYTKVKKAGGKAVLLNCSEGLENNYYELSMVSFLKDSASGVDYGVIIVNINNIAIHNILSEIDLGLEDSTYLITNEGRILAATSNVDQEVLAKRQFMQDVMGQASVSERESFESDDAGTKYLVSFRKSSKTGLIAVTVVPNSSVTVGVRDILKTTVYAGALFASLAIVFGVIFSLRMSRSMKSLMAVMSKAEKGDLTASLSMKRKDEIGQLVRSFDKMIVRIKDLVIQNKQAAQEVADSSAKMATISSDSSRIFTEISQAIAEVAHGSSNQATEVESSVRSVSQLANRITSTVERTKLMEEDAGTMIALSDSGMMVIDNLSKKTVETNALAAEVASEMGRLNEYVKNINQITNVLRGIADQTNLLALNAAIEAARAGESGKGFAVVADEIRKLAEQSNNHTRDIQKHIENVFKQTQSSVNLVMRTDTFFREQGEMVTQTAEMFAKISETTSKLSKDISEVYQMTMGMDDYKESVMSSMESISSVSEQVSASTEEVSASTQEQLTSIEKLDHMAKSLNALSDDLLKKIEKFMV